jgi:hypothetical protein
MDTDASLVMHTIALLGPGFTKTMFSGAIKSRFATARLGQITAAGDES